MKVGVVVVTHGQLATELLNAAEMIVGDLPHFAAVSIGWHEDVDQAREGIGKAIERVREKVTTDDRPGARPCGAPAPTAVRSDLVPSCRRRFPSERSARKHSLRR